MALEFEKEKVLTEVSLESFEEKSLSNVVPNYGKPWWRVPHLRKLNLVLLVPLMTPYVPGYDGSMFNGMQSMQSWQDQFGHPTGPKLGMIATMQTIGNIASTPIAPYVTDRWGRRWPIVVGSFISVVAAIVQSQATNITMLTISRAIVGFGSGIASTAAGPLIAELAYPTHRAILTAMFTTFWYLASMIAAWTAYGGYHIPSGWSWRISPLVQAIPCVIQVLFMFLVPESPRWLVANGREKQAEKDLAMLHGGKKEPTELVQFELDEIRTAIRNERAQQTSSYKHFITTPGNRYRLFIAVTLGLLTQWCGNGLATYYLVPVLRGIGMTNPVTQNMINSALQTFNYVVVIGSSLIIERAGRRSLLLVSHFGMAFALIIWTVFSAVKEDSGHSNSGLGVGIVIMIFVFFFFYNLSLNPVPMTYLLELLPYTLRAKGVTIYMQVQNLSSVFFGFVNPIALDAIGWRYYIVFACLVACFIVMIWRTYPETRGRSLEEVAQILDGDDALDLERRSSNGDDTLR